MRNPQGYATIVSPTASVANFDKFRCEEIPAGLFEADTFTCNHCNRVVHVKARVSMDEFGSMCRNCMKMTCPTCADGPCVPFMKKIEQMEQKDYIRRQYDL
mgnify:FL=1